MEITKEEFIEYEKVRQSGKTNMFMVTVVMSLSGLTKEKILCIMKTYTELDKKYPDVRKTNFDKDDDEEDEKDE